MKIKKIKITNFRSIKDTIEIELPQITALIGPNNSGKSNILNALYKVLGRDWVTVNNLTEEDVYMKEYDRDINIEIELSGGIKVTRKINIIRTAIELSFEGEGKTPNAGYIMHKATFPCICAVSLNKECALAHSRACGGRLRHLPYTPQCASSRSVFFFTRKQFPVKKEIFCRDRVRRA